MDAITKTMKALERNNVKAYLAEDRNQARELVMSMIGKDEVVGAGGSVTLDECGIREELRDGYKFLDWFKEGIEADEKKKLLRQTLTCDVFISGSNALTEDGKIVNIDGRGNRVSAMIFGPKRVILVAGKNKITKNLDKAIDRVRNVAAPKNCVRLSKKHHVQQQESAQTAQALTGYVHPLLS